MEKIVENKEDSWIKKVFNHLKAFLVSTWLIVISAFGKSNLAVAGYLEEQRKAAQQKEIAEVQERINKMLKCKGLPIIDNNNIKNQNMTNKKFMVFI